jgi:hypothetical protein
LRRYLEQDQEFLMLIISTVLISIKLYVNSEQSDIEWNIFSQVCFLTLAEKIYQLLCLIWNINEELTA